MRQHILEHVRKLDNFVLTLLPNYDIRKAQFLAKEAIDMPRASSKRVDLRDASATTSSSDHLEDTTIKCVECPECHRLFCADCCVPWHLSMSCEEYQSLPADERDSDDVTLHRLAQNRQWRRCQECRRMIELTQGCFHMTCWCGHEFCYACGAGYRNKQQTCECLYWDEHSIINRSAPNEAFDWTLFSGLTDNYTDHEQSQMALLQRFLSHDFTLSPSLQTASRLHPHEDSVDSAIRDLHQVPLLGSFVSAISGSSYDQLPFD